MPEGGSLEMNLQSSVGSDAKTGPVFMTATKHFRMLAHLLVFFDHTSCR